MRPKRSALIGASVVVFLTSFAAVVANAAPVQVSCSTYSKVKGANEVYTMQLDLEKKSGSIVRDGGPASAVPVVSNDKAIAVFHNADGGQYIYYIARDTARLTASFAKGGKVSRDEVYGACATSSGGAL